jgi:hypothetical protein
LCLTFLKSVRMKTKVHISFVVLFLSLFLACKKDSDTTSLRIKMTDAPAAFEEVNVDLQEVKIKFQNDTSSWVAMDANPGIYNLLELQNGIDTLIAEGVYQTGKVKEIRLILGADNSIKAGGEVWPLTIPSGSESGLKIKIDKQLRAGIDSLVIDFDAALSVHNEAGGYKLRPVVKLVP